MPDSRSNKRPMLPEERRSKILKELQENRQVRVAELSKRFHTSEVTIRSDLKALHSRGLVRRAHGGAIAPDAVAESPLEERIHAHAEEKRRIGAAAAALVQDGDCIVLDSGTTTHEIAKRLKGKQDLRVITNGVNVAMELLGVRGIQLVMLGGMLRDDSLSVAGHFAEQMLEHLLADKVFLGATSWDLRFGLSTGNPEEARVSQAMVRIARERILVADSSKFGSRSLSRIGSLLDMHKVITDRALPADVQQELRSKGLELVLV